MKRLTWLLALAFLAGAAPAQTGAAPRVITAKAPFGGFRPQAARGADGTLHVVQGDARHRGDVFYTRRAEGAAEFTAPIRVNATPGTVAGFAMAVGPGGRVHVLMRPNPRYLKVRMPDKAKLRIFDLKYMLYTRLTADGASFEPERDLSGDTLALEGMGTVLAGPDGVVRAFWHGQLEEEIDEPGRRIYTAVSSDGGATFTAPRPISTDAVGACQCCAMAGLLGDDGAIYLAFRGARTVPAGHSKDSYLLVSTDSGASFDARLLEEWENAGCPGSTCGLAATPAGAWTAWQTRTQVGLASPPARRLAVPGAAAQSAPRLCANARGEVLLVWTEVRPQARGAGDLRWQVYDASGAPLGSPGRLRGGVAAGWGGAAAYAEADGRFVILYDGAGARGVIR